MTDETQPAAAEAGNQQQGFGLKRVYVKDISFEVPAGAAAFGLPGQPKVNQDMGSSVKKVNDTHFEVELGITITIEMDDKKVAFLAEVKQAGIFEVMGLEGPQLQHFLSVVCPQILFPYARQCLDTLATQGGFAPVMLPHVDFQALYMQAVEQSKNETKN